MPVQDIKKEIDGKLGACYLNKTGCLTWVVLLPDETQPHLYEVWQERFEHYMADLVFNDAENLAAYLRAEYIDLEGLTSGMIAVAFDKNITGLLLIRFPGDGNTPGLPDITPGEL
jgi:hypothetical protein